MNRQILTNQQMRTQYSLEVFKNNYNTSSKLRHNYDQYEEYPKHIHSTSRAQSAGMNTYNSIRDSTIQKMREVDQFASKHPSAGTPFSGNPYA
jgi:hypothetical protein